MLWEDSFDMVEAIGSINALGWGIWFLLHPTLFDDAPVIFAVLERFGDEHFWGSILVLLGLSNLVGVALDRYRIRKKLAMIGAVLWAFICMGFFLQNPQAIIVLVTAENALLSAWGFIRHAHRARIRKEVREEIHSTNKKI